MNRTYLTDNGEIEMKRESFSLMDLAAVCEKLTVSFEVLLYCHNSKLHLLILQDCEMREKRGKNSIERK